MAMTKSKVDLKRISMNIPTELYDKICKYSENLGINTTAGVIVLLNQALNNNSMIELMPVMFSVMNDIKSGTVTQETVSNFQLLEEQNKNK